MVNRDIVIKDKAQVGDTIGLILDTARNEANSPEVQEIIAKIPGKTQEEFCKNLFDFVCEISHYQEDPHGHEMVTTPRRFLQRCANGEGVDCKKFTVFLASCLTAAGIPVLAKVISYDGKAYEHIYVIVPNLDGSYITLDPVNDEQYNKELAHKKAVVFDIYGNEMKLSLLKGQTKTMITQVRSGVGKSVRSLDDDIYGCAGMGNSYYGMPQGTGIGALFNASPGRWANVVGSNKGIAAIFLPMFTDAAYRPARLQAKVDKLETWVFENSQGRYTDGQIRAGISSGIKRATGENPTMLIRQMEAAFLGTPLRGQTRTMTEQIYTGVGQSNGEAKTLPTAGEAENEGSGESVVGIIDAIFKIGKALVDMVGSLKNEATKLGSDTVWGSEDWTEYFQVKTRTTWTPPIFNWIMVTDQKLRTGAGQTTDDVYFVYQNKMHKFPSAAVFEQVGDSIGFGWENVAYRNPSKRLAGIGAAYLTMGAPLTGDATNVINQIRTLYGGFPSDVANNVPPDGYTSPNDQEPGGTVPNPPQKAGDTNLLPVAAAVAALAFLT